MPFTRSFDTRITAAVTGLSAARSETSVDRSWGHARNALLPPDIRIGAGYRPRMLVWSVSFGNGTSCAGCQRESSIRRTAVGAGAALHLGRSGCAGVRGAGIVAHTGRCIRAATCWRPRLPGATDDSHFLVELIETLLLVGEIAAAHTWLERPAWQQVDTRDTLWRYADFCQRLGRHAQSLEALGRLVASNRDADVLRYSRGRQLELWGPHRRGCIRIRGVPGAPARRWQRSLSIGAPAPA